MTTAVFNMTNSDFNAGMIVSSPIRGRYDDEVFPEAVAQYMKSLRGLVLESAETKRKRLSILDQWKVEAYARNKYGDEYVSEDELGFEVTYMGDPADHNHLY